MAKSSRDGTNSIIACRKPSGKGGRLYIVRSSSLIESLEELHGNIQLWVQRFIGVQDLLDDNVLVSDDEAVGGEVLRKFYQIIMSMRLLSGRTIIVCFRVGKETKRHV